MNQNKFFIGLLLFSFVLLCMLFAYIHKYNSKPQEISIEKQFQAKDIKGRNPYAGLLLSNQSFEDFDFTKYDKDKKIYRISGKKITGQNKRFGIFRIAIGKVLEIKDAQVTFYEYDKPVSYLSSSFGEMDLATSELNLSKRPCMITEDKKILICDNIIYSEESNITGNGNCILKAQGEIVKADIIKADIKLNNYQVINKNKTKKPIINIGKIIGIGK